MLLMIIVGIVVLIAGKLKLTRSISLSGRRARWYGATLILTAIPFTLLFGGLLAVLLPESVLGHPVYRRVLNYAVLIGYLVLLALPFRTPPDTGHEQQPQA